MLSPTLLSTILIVDNDPKTVRLLKMRLTSVGYQVITASNGLEGIEKFREHNPILTMLDVDMPHMSGLEVLAKIREIHDDTSVLIMTAYGSEKIAVEALKRGASDYVNKPFDKKEIMHVVKENIERAELVNERNFLVSQMKNTTQGFKTLIEKINELKVSNSSLLTAITTKSELLIQLEKANTRLKELSIRDGLTQLYNHVYFQERLSEEFSRAHRYQTKLSLIMMDIDDFKQVNDTFGHQVGDDVLVKLAHITMESVRVIDLAARYGGEEFMIILPQIDKQGAIQLANRLRQEVATAFINFFPEKYHSLTLSIGIASIPEDRITSKYEFIKLADKALYTAKRTGKDKVVASSDPSEYDK